VTDPEFPFVGVIEHTNFEAASAYGGRHILYLSRYLPVDDAWWALSDDEILALAWTHLSRMYPQLERHHLEGFHVWRERWAQPIVEAGYAARLPAQVSPWPGLYVASMAQIYPEDRGTNHAVREGRRIARRMAAELAS
jgi:protoporphyrinogen oxidase